MQTEQAGRQVRGHKTQRFRPLDVKRLSKQNVICSKSFGKEITSREEMAEAVCTYTARAAEKLREQESLASRITVFLRTNAFH